MTINRVTLKPPKIVRVLATMVLLLVLANIAAQLTKYLTGHDSLYGLVGLFDFDNEHNIPSYFSAALLLFAALLLGVITNLKKKSGAPHGLSWTILSFAFLYMAVDEATVIHERMLDRLTRELLGDPTIGIFHFAWVIPGIVVVFFFALLFLKFFLHLPQTTKSVVLLAATLFIGGAIGFELIGGQYASLHGRKNLTYSMLATVEESMEMAGVIVFIYALLKYIQGQYGEVRFRFEDSAENSRPAPEV
jgi:hypothetical protein